MSEFYVYGFHAVTQRLQQAPQSCIELVCTERRNPRLQQLIEQAGSLGIRVRFAKRDEIGSLCASDRHQGCALLTRENTPGMTFNDCLQGLNEDSLLLLLDGIQDPHNLGACLRSADACAVDAVIIPRDRSVKINATVRKVAAGAAESVAVIEVTNIVRSLEQLKKAGVWIYGSSGDASESLYDHNYQGPVALVMGAEGKGLRRLTMEACDHLVRLPMLGQVESLNVSVATGICLYEIRRARHATG